MTSPSESCEPYEPQLVALLYGELEGRERQALERHLLACSGCRRQFEDLRAARNELSLWEGPTLDFLDPQPPAELVGAVRDRAGAETPAPPNVGIAPRPRPRRLWVARLSGVAAALLVTLALLGVEVRLGQGALQLTFALPGSTPGGDLVVPPTEGTDDLQRIATEELDEHSDRLRLEMADLLREFAEREETRRRELGTWLERVREEDRRTFEGLADLVERSLQENRRENQASKEAIVELARVLLPNETNPVDSYR